MSSGDAEQEGEEEERRRLRRDVRMFLCDDRLFPPSASAAAAAAGADLDSVDLDSVDWERGARAYLPWVAFTRGEGERVVTVHTHREDPHAHVARRVLRPEETEPRTRFRLDFGEDAPSENRRADRHPAHVWCWLFDFLGCGERRLLGGEAEDEDRRRRRCTLRASRQDAPPPASDDDVRDALAALDDGSLRGILASAAELFAGSLRIDLRDEAFAVSLSTHVAFERRRPLHDFLRGLGEGGGGEGEETPPPPPRWAFRKRVWVGSNGSAEGGLAFGSRHPSVGRLSRLLSEHQRARRISGRLDLRMSGAALRHAYGCDWSWVISTVLALADHGVGIGDDRGTAGDLLVRRMAEEEAGELGGAGGSLLVKSAARVPPFPANASKK